MLHQKKNLKGFSIVEIAIVLSVVGVIVSGLWVLMGQVSDSVKRHKLSQEITETVNAIRATYANQTAINGSTSTIMTKLANLKTVFPADMIGPDGMPNNPWRVVTGGSFNVCAWVVGHTACGTAVVAGSALFAIELTALDQATCINVATGDTGSSMPQGLVDVYIDGTAAGPGAATPLPLPVSVNTARADCTNATGNTVDFIYRLNPSSAPGRSF